MGSSLTDTSRSFAKRARPGTSRRAWHWTLHRSGVTPSHWWSWSSMWKIRGWSLGARSMLRSKKWESKLSHLHTILFSQSFTTERFKMQANILHILHIVFPRTLPTLYMKKGWIVTSGKYLLQFTRCWAKSTIVT